MVKKTRKVNRASRALTKEQYENLKAHVHEDGDLRLYAIISLLALATRISDVLNFSVKDLYKPNGSIQPYLKFYEQKTNKSRTLDFGNKNLQKALLQYYPILKQMNLGRDSLLFYTKNQKLPLTRTDVFRLLNKYKERIGAEQISSHSIRKYTCKQLVMAHGKAIESISEMLNHSSTSITRVYLDINKEDVKKLYATMDI